MYVCMSWYSCQCIQSWRQCSCGDNADASLLTRSFVPHSYTLFCGFSSESSGKRNCSRQLSCIQSTHGCGPLSPFGSFHSCGTSPEPGSSSSLPSQSHSHRGSRSPPKCPCWFPWCRGGWIPPEFLHHPFFSFFFGVASSSHLQLPSHWLHCLVPKKQSGC